MKNRMIWGVVLTLIYGSVAIPAQAQGFDSGWNMGGCVLSPGQTADFTREFKAYQTYFITADGGEGAHDVDVQILSSSGRVIVEDVRSDKSAIVEFRPSYTGQYTIRVKLASGVGKPLCFFSVVVLSGGWEISQETAINVLAKLAAVGTVLEGELERFYGYVMKPGDRFSMTIDGLRGDYSLYAVGGDSVSDLDLTVRRNGLVIARDEMDDAFPVCEFSNSSGSRIEFEIHYYSGKGAAFVMVGILKQGGGLPGVRRL